MGEPRHGVDTIRWIARQAWCNGKIGTWGGSALGINQLMLAGAGARPLTCQHITVAEPNLHQALFPGGVFKKSLVEDWLRVTQHAPDALAHWTRHPAYDAFWQARDVNRRYRFVDAPAVHIGGYYDIFAQGTIDAFVGYQARGGQNARGTQKLLMGPRAHGRPLAAAAHPCNTTLPAERPYLGVSQADFGRIAYLHLRPTEPRAHSRRAGTELPAGPRDQQRIESRPDVLVFTSAPLHKRLHYARR